MSCSEEDGGAWGTTRSWPWEKERRMLPAAAKGPWDGARCCGEGGVGASPAAAAAA